jgi:hypothetical protein
VQIYDSGGAISDRTIVRNNFIYGNEGYGNVTLNHGDDIQFYNNVLYDAHIGVEVRYGTPNNVTIYNNTLYNHDEQAIEIGSGVTNTRIQNNILRLSSTVTNSGSGTVQSTNYTADPLFVNAAARILSLQSGSGAVDTGATLASVTTDIIGTTRPVGAAYDIGAYER